MSIYNNQSVFPAQKKATSEKNEDWRRACVDNAEMLALFRNEGLRQSHRNKVINYNLYSDILDQADIEATCNPSQIVGYTSPASVKNYPIANPKIDLLVGESIARKLKVRARVINQDAISLKEVELGKKFQSLFQSHLEIFTKEGNIPQEQLSEDLRNFDNYQNFEYQDVREKTATNIIEYLTSHLKLDNLFSKGFKDALIVAEEIYDIDIIGGEPVVKRLNPKNVFTVRSGESNYTEDSDIILITGYMSVGQIIDEYYEHLSPTDIDYIESGMVGNYSGGSKLGIDIGRKPDLPLQVNEGIDLVYLENNLTWGTTHDGEGNIRVSKIRWKSMRKLKEVKYYDDLGNEQYEIYDENYKIDKTKGEEEKILWVSEWWEGHKIGGGPSSSDNSGAIYVKMQPRPIQGRRMENLSRCHPGIVGSIYNTNDNRGVSLMDRMKPYQYLYNILAYNTELAIAKNWGKIIRINVAEIPEGWSVDKWLSFARGMNASFYDPFKESAKGTSTGKIVGGLNNQASVLDAEMGNTIQLYMNSMAYIKQELGEISGVSQARQGQIAQRAAVGNTEREVSQSSHITEYWFAEHDLVKLRVLECLLEAAKYAWKDKKNKKIQYILDDGASVLFELDGEQFAECEYGLLLEDADNSSEKMQTMKQLAHAGLQTGALNYSQLLDIFSTESMSSTRRKIQRSEINKEKAQQAQAQADRDLKNKQIETIASEAEKDRDFKREEWDREDNRVVAELSNKIEVALISKEAKEMDMDKNNDGMPDYISIEKLKQDALKISHEIDLKKKALEETKRHNKATENKSK